MNSDNGRSRVDSFVSESSTEEPRKVMSGPFLIYQKVELEIDMRKEQVKGSTTLWLGYLGEDRTATLLPSQLSLSCRQCKIDNVWVNHTRAQHVEYEDLLECLSKHKDAQSLNGRDLWSNYRVALASANAVTSGEVVIQVPEMSKERHVEIDDVQLEAPSASQAAALARLAMVSDCRENVYDKGGRMLQVKVDFRVRKPQAGIRFWGSEEEMQCCYTCYGDPLLNLDGVRCWLPCLDEPKQRGVFDIVLKTPIGMHVACSGEQVSSTVENAGMLQSRFVTTNRLPARAVGFFVGSVQRHSIQLFRVDGEFWVPIPSSRAGCSDSVKSTDPHSGTSEDGDHGTDDVDPAILSKVRHTTLGIDRAVRFIHKTLERHSNTGKFVQVFIPDLAVDYACFQSLVLMSDTYLYDTNEVDAEIPSHIALVHAYTFQWLLGSFPLLKYDDQWLVYGICGFIVDLYVNFAYGQDEARYRFVKMHDAVIALERQNRSIQLRNTLVYDLYEQALPWNIEILRLKSCVCAHMIDHRMPQEHENLRMAIHSALKAPETIAAMRRNMKERPTQHGAILRIPDSPWQEIPGTMTPRPHAAPDESPFSTPRRRPSIDGSDVPRPMGLQRQSSIGMVEPITEWFNECYNTERFMKLVISCAGGAAGDLNGDFITNWIDNTGALFMRCGIRFDKRHKHVELVSQQVSRTKNYKGPFSIKIVEADETYKTHDSKLPNFGAELKSERFVARPKDRKRKKDADARDDEAALHTARAKDPQSILFVDMDPSYLWIREVWLAQKDTMFLEQLWIDNLWGQMHAIQNMGRSKGQTQGPIKYRPRGLFDCLIAANVIPNFVHTANVRGEAALALMRWQNETAPPTAQADVGVAWLGMNFLLRAFREMFLDPTSDLPLPNNFLDDDSYTVRKACVQAISQLRAKNGATPADAIAILLCIAENNDNTTNKVDDSYYLCLLLVSLSRIRVSSDRQSLDRLQAIIDIAKIYYERDGTIPSHDLWVSAAALECLCAMDIQKGGKWSLDYDIIATTTTSTYVQLAALQSVMRLYVARDIAEALVPNASQTGDPIFGLSVSAQPEGLSLALDVALNAIHNSDDPSFRQNTALILMDVIMDRPPSYVTRVLLRGEPLSCLVVADPLVCADPVPVRYQQMLKELLQRPHERLTSCVRLMCYLIATHLKYDQTTRSMLLHLYLYIWGENIPPCVTSHSSPPEFREEYFTNMMKANLNVVEPAYADSEIEELLRNGPNTNTNPPVLDDDGSNLANSSGIVMSLKRPRDDHSETTDATAEDQGKEVKKVKSLSFVLNSS